MGLRAVVFLKVPGQVGDGDVARPPKLREAHHEAANAPVA